MSKSVYSIVLSDEVVAAVDLMALRLGTNRSNLINQILAERVSVVTPERRIKDIFDNIFRLLDEQFIQDSSTADTALAFRSPIAYKYKPTVRYSVELLRTPEGEHIGNLKISFRTRSQAFMQILSSFYNAWISSEREHNKRDVKYFADSDRLVREIYFPKGEKSISSEQLGELIGEYVKAFDAALKGYFASADMPEAAAHTVSEIYSNALKNGIDKI
ncbi:hypothetical protein [Ruminococcus sp. NK3A76]|uniref:hypothetical protein n=1 Tax=Ruminococcus sp. NK3A76 TaxID=877411 RepID=UPI0004911B5D|nr:hypothetical protein [Ruminococcus sp. NK3A76]